MADYREVKCPWCPKKLVSRYRADLSKHKTHGYCQHCHNEYTVIYGDGEVRAVKGYA